MKRSLLICLVCVFGFNSINAQIEPGITGGIDLTSINLKREYPSALNIQGTLGYHIGLDLRLPIVENLNLNTGLLLTKTGFKQILSYPFRSSLAEYDSVITFNVSAYNIEVPILLEFKAKFEKMNILFGIGPYVSYGLFGKVNLDIQSLSTDINYSENIRWKPYYEPSEELGKQLIYQSGYSQIKRLDYGAMIKFGIQFKTLTINAEYKYGIANRMSAYGLHEKMNNQSLGIGLTYQFK